MLHGDINHSNIIVREETSTHSLRLAGLIDFGEMVEGPVVVDLAILIMSIMTLSNHHKPDIVHITRQLLKGYCMHKSRLGDVDLELLYHALPARCAQLIVGCTYDALRDPDNSGYILSPVDDCYTAIREFYSLYVRKEEFIGKLSDIL